MLPEHIGQCAELREHSYYISDSVGEVSSLYCNAKQSLLHGQGKNQSQGLRMHGDAIGVG